MKLYHADIFIPAALREQAEQTSFEKLVWSRHARLEIIRDKYGVLQANQIPHKFNGSDWWTLVELEAEGAQISKYVFRRPVDSWRSLVIVLRPEPRRHNGPWVATVVTAWTNKNSDRHDTLDKSKYSLS